MDDYFISLGSKYREAKEDFAGLILIQILIFLISQWISMGGIIMIIRV